MPKRISKFNTHDVVNAINELYEKVSQIAPLRGDGLVEIKRSGANATVRLNMDKVRARIPKLGMTSGIGPIYKAYCKDDAGSGTTIVCFLGTDDSGSAAWAVATAYSVGDVVSNSGVYYVCILAHTSSSDDQPGSGVNWSTYWETIQEVTVTCEIVNGTALNSASPRLENGDLIHVYKDASDTWRPLFPFQTTEDCS